VVVAGRRHATPEGEAESVLTAGEAIELCDALAGAGVRYWVVGGWGVDALLGRETRPHKDLDILVLVDDLPRLRRIFASMGFELSSVWEESWIIGSDAEAWPTAFVATDAAGRPIDVHLIEIEDGRIIQHYEQQWPLPPSFATTGTIAGRDIPCATLAAQLAMHTGYALPEAHQLDVDLLSGIRS